jgi:spore germination protein YaaH
MSPHRRASARALAQRLVIAAILGCLALGSMPALPSTASTAAAAATIDPGIDPIVAQPRPLDRIVYGYLPYWRLDASTAGTIQYDLVSTIAFFGLGINADGSLDTTWRGYTAYTSDDAVAVTNAAHAAGVRVVPTFQLFDSSTGMAKMTAFLANTAVQDVFIGQALDLMVRRSADGASIDFEPLPDTQAPGFVAFVARFAAAMRARLPGSQLVVATSAGAGAALVTGLVPLVDYMFVMTYNYHWSGSTVTGPIAPLDNAPRTVKIHISRYLTRAPAAKIILGVPYYGYSWPVTSAVPNATVQTNRTVFGGVRSVTYAAALDFLAAHPTVVRHEDTLQGSAYFTYWDSTYKTYRQVYFEDELSAAAKYDYALATNLAGVGTWTLGNDAGYSQLWNTLRAKFYAPIHAVAVSGTVAHVKRVGAYVYATITRRARNVGNVPEHGTLRWIVRDARGRARASGTTTFTLLPGVAWGRSVVAKIGSASALPSGTYHAWFTFLGTNGTWRSTAVSFRQPY